jgi:amino acid adenylation domain-containing protein
VAGTNGNVAGLLVTAAERRGAAPAVIERSGTTDYATLAGRAGGVATDLAARGVAAGDPVAILLDRGADAAAVSLGVTAAGGIALTVNEALRPRQIEQLLAQSGTRWLVSSAELLARQPRALATAATVIDAATLPARGALAPLPRDPDDVAQIIYTSGSTGRPKGVMISHGNLLAVTRIVTAYLGIGPSDRIASLLPFSFVYGFNQLLCALGTGAALVVETSPLAQQIVATLRDRAVTVLAAVPPLWSQLLGVEAFAAAPLGDLRVMTNAGGRLPVERVRALRRAQPRARLFLMYGLTEALRSTFLDPGEVDRHPDSIGKPIAETEIFVVREDGTPCGGDEVGELVHGGPTVTLGYWNDPEGTALVYRPHPARPRERVVYSGDLVRRDADGFLYHVGRKDRMIKTLGFRVSPDEVAEALYASGLVVETAVVGEPDEQRGERIAAFVVLAAGATVERLTAWCRAELPRHLQPARFAVRDALPRNASGKFDFQALQGTA